MHPFHSRKLVWNSQCLQGIWTFVVFVLILTAVVVYRTRNIVLPADLFKIFNSVIYFGDILVLRGSNWVSSIHFGDFVFKVSLTVLVVRFVSRCVTEEKTNSLRRLNALFVWNACAFRSKIFKRLFHHPVVKNNAINNMVTFGRWQWMSYVYMYIYSVWWFSVLLQKQCVIGWLHVFDKLTK